jgi:predicted nucleic acid-binding protein
MRIFLEANILFSAAKSKGAVRELLGLLFKSHHEFCADAFVVEEARRNLAAKAPDGLAALEALLSRVEVAEVQSSNALDESLPLPEKDRPVLAAAIHNRCAALLTGDRAHFGALYGKTIRGVTIHSPRSLAEKLVK